MKKIISAALVLVLLMLCGCSAGPKPIESLMRPPYIGADKELQRSINKLLGSSIILCSPKSGEFHTAITLHDLDSDGEEEAVVFYQKDRDTTTVRMSVLKEYNGKWEIVSDFAGSGSGVVSVEFADLNYNGFDDILVSWTLFDNNTNKSLTVYSASLDDSVLKIVACATEPFNLMRVEEVFGSGEKQVILAYADTSKTPVRTAVRVLEMTQHGTISLICETKLDASFASLASISADKPEGFSYPRIFIDANISDSNMITEVLTWSQSSKSFIQMFSGTGDKSVTALTQRSSNLPCKDIDSDGLIEIPQRRLMSELINGEVSTGYLLDWCSVSENGLEPKLHYIVNTQENYKLLFPNEWFDKVFVGNEPASRAWSFSNSDDDLLFVITAYSLDGWDRITDKITEVLLIQSDTVFTCTITELGEKFGVTATDLLKFFSTGV